MGGAVSSGRDNNELIDNLMGGNYIRTRCVERVFRALDRADYMTPEARDQAYKDLAWRNGPLHMSAPCIYSEVMEGLELRPGLSFLNVGSGTGYLSTLVGLIIGSSGISHGVEVHPLVVEYSTKKMSQFLENSPTLDEFDFCEPKFYGGNGLCLAPLQSPYDRVYCGAGCPEEYQNYFKQLIKVGGVLVMPLNDNLVQVRRVGDAEWSSRSLLNVSFATLRVPTKDEASDLIKLEEQAPPRLQQLARGVIRGAMRAGLMRRHPELREPPQRQPPAKKSCPRRICIPIEDDSDVEGLNALHDMDRNGGAHEMNALLSLVLSMGQNRVAGALRFDPLDSPLDSEEDDDDADAGDDDDADDGSGGGGGTPRSDPSAPRSKEASPESSVGSGSGGGEGADAGAEGGEGAEGGARATFRSRRGLLTFEFRDAQPAREPPSEPVAPSTSATDAGADAPVADGDATATKSREEPRSGPSRDDDDDNDSPGVPAEVEIFLGKSQPGCSKLLGQMDWEHDTIEEEDDEFFSEEDEEAVEEQAGDKACEEDKRQKLDSGIGEESTPTSEASPGKSDAKTDDSDAEPGRSGSLTDDMDDNQDSRRRLQKRGRRAGGRSSASNSWSDSSTASGSGGTGAAGSATARRRCKRRAPDAAAPTPAPPGPDARRVRLSVLMKRGVKELPLPHALKKYVNLGRCFEF